MCSLFDCGVDVLLSGTTHCSNTRNRTGPGRVPCRFGRVTRTHLADHLDLAALGSCHLAWSMDDLLGDFGLLLLLGPRSIFVAAGWKIDGSPHPTACR